MAIKLTEKDFMGEEEIKDLLIEAYGERCIPKNQELYKSMFYEEEGEFGGTVFEPNIGGQAYAIVRFYPYCCVVAKNYKHSLKDGRVFAADILNVKYQKIVAEHTDDKEFLESFYEYAKKSYNEKTKNAREHAVKNNLPTDFIDDKENRYEDVFEDGFIDYKENYAEFEKIITKKLGKEKEMTK